jgi:hypothetical protein
MIQVSDCKHLRTFSVVSLKPHKQHMSYKLAYYLFILLFIYLYDACAAQSKINPHDLFCTYVSYVSSIVIYFDENTLVTYSIGFYLLLVKKR